MGRGGWDDPSARTTRAIADSPRCDARSQGSVSATPLSDSSLAALPAELARLGVPGWAGEKAAFLSILN